MPRSLTKVVGVQGIEVRPEAVTFSNSTEGKLYIHGRSDARHCLKTTRGRAIERVNRITLDHVLKDNPRTNCFKMDIEGAELEILHQAKFPKRIRCLVFEYSYTP